MASLRSDRARKPYSRPEPRPRGGVPGGMWLHDRAPEAISKSAAPNSKLVISNLHYEITPKDLTAIFGQIGTLVREPLIRYDRSGRSSGVAIVSFETQAEAAQAKKQYEGVLAKGQPMSIAFDTAPPPSVRNARRNSAPSSLLNRIQKPPLLDRLSRDGSASKPAAGTPTGPYVHTYQASHFFESSTAVNATEGPAQSARGLEAEAQDLPPKKPKTAEELDKELDAFMVDDSAPAVNAQQPASVVQAEADVEMA